MRFFNFHQMARKMHCVRKLKNCKSGSSDGLVGELLKHGG